MSIGTTTGMVYVVMEGDGNGGWPEQAFADRAAAEAYAERVEPCAKDHDHQAKVGEHTEWVEVTSESAVDAFRMTGTVAGVPVSREELIAFLREVQVPQTITDYEPRDAVGCDGAIHHSGWVAEVELS